MEKNRLYRAIPKVDSLLAIQEIQKLLPLYERAVVVEEIQNALTQIRIDVSAEKIKDSRTMEQVLAHLVPEIIQRVSRRYEPTLRRVINGTGVILHTNLGRAPLSEKHMQQVTRVATGYSNLEFNLQTGQRGSRYQYVENLLCELTGAEAAMVVNNNAAAVLLALHTIAKGQEVPVSRGELVEVGGKFRIPDVMEMSGAQIIEVGTTNKTHLEDYQNVMNSQTAAILKVHTSNYQIVGFTESVTVSQLVPLASEYQIPIIEDLGSGVLLDLSKYGLRKEPTVQESLRNGADVVTFSGDKLLGGPQAGMIVGKKCYIDSMKKNQLTRALRVDKFTASTLEMVLLEYQAEQRAVAQIPVLRMLTKANKIIKQEAQTLQRLLQPILEHIQVDVIACNSQVGGGSLPMEYLPSYAIALHSDKLTATALQQVMRGLDVPIIGRIVEDNVLIDMRTVEQSDWTVIQDGLKTLENINEIEDRTRLEELDRIEKLDRIEEGRKT